MSLLVLLVGLLGVLCVARGDDCYNNFDCYNNGVCNNSVCECDDNYEGTNCELEAANCSLAQIRIYEDNFYQICILLEGKMYWAYVCGDVNLCTVTNTLCQNCDFSCANSFVCSAYSSGCVSGDSSSFCEIIDTNGANTLYSLIALILIISLIPILI